MRTFRWTCGGSAGEVAPLRDDYLGRLRKGGVRVEFLTVGGDMRVTMDGEGRPDARAREMIDDVVEEAQGSDELRVVRTAADLDAALAGDEVGLVLHFEGCRPLLGQVELAHAFHGLGLRSAQLTWNYRNEVADRIGAAEPGGLTAEGREIVAELDLGFLFDVSHLAEQGFWELIELSEAPWSRRTRTPPRSGRTRGTSTTSGSRRSRPGAATSASASSRPSSGRSRAWSA